MKSRGFPIGNVENTRKKKKRFNFQLTLLDPVYLCIPRPGLRQFDAKVYKSKTGPHIFQKLCTQVYKPFSIDLRQKMKIILKVYLELNRN